MKFQTIFMLTALVITSLVFSGCSKSKKSKSKSRYNPDAKVEVKTVGSAENNVEDAREIVLEYIKAFRAGNLKQAMALSTEEFKNDTEYFFKCYHFDAGKSSITEPQRIAHYNESRKEFRDLLASGEITSADVHFGGALVKTESAKFVLSVEKRQLRISKLSRLY